MVKKLLKVILSIENLTGYYRNYCLFGKVIKTLVIFRVCIEIVLTCSSWFLPNINSNVMFNSVLNIHSIVMLLIPIYNSKNFKTLLSQLNNSEVFNFPAIQANENKIKGRKQVLMLFVIIFNSLICIIDFTFYCVFWDAFSNEVQCPSLYFLFELVFNLGYYRNLCQYSVIHCYLSLLSELIDSITRSVNAEIALRAQPRADDATPSSVQTEPQLFDKWSAAYDVAAKISKQCNIIFGFQMSVMLAMFIHFSIQKLYTITRTNVLGNTLSLLHYQVIFGISIIEYQVSLFVMSRAGQALVNSAESLRRRLTVLLVHSCEYEAQYKATRALLRQVATHPIQTKAFGSVTVDMSLLPACLAFSVSYTVIALQYNKVV